MADFEIISRAPAADIRVVEAAGAAVRQRVEALVECRMMNVYGKDGGFSQLKVETWPLSLPIEILLHGNSRDDVEANLELAILGAADRRTVVWRTPPEIADSTDRLNDREREYGAELWSGYARFHV